MDYGFSKSTVASADQYHDLSGLQAIKQEKDDDKALKKVAQQFESLFMHELLKNMRKANAVFEEGSLFSSSESKMFRDMYDQQLSVELGAKNALGIADILYQQLSKQSAYPPSQDIKETEFNVPSRPIASAPEQSFANKNADVATSTLSGTGERKAEAFSSADDFVEKLLPLAKGVAKVLGLDPLVLVAQAALETGWGKHLLKDAAGNLSHNLFNIKANNTWQGAVVSKDAVEYRDGIAVKERSAFRQYPSFERSFADFIDFLQTNPRYQTALHSDGSAAEFVGALQQAGYATDPNYAQKVLRVYQRMVAQRSPGSAVDE